ncbi:hypothetical protein C8Q78DRAFT_1148283 [Trametes maxima]|nr:hypothetical protein C8Q78DRAFT_1148283 [Trametes maxima]
MGRAQGHATPRRQQRADGGRTRVRVRAWAWTGLDKGRSCGAVANRGAGSGRAVRSAACGMIVHGAWGRVWKANTSTKAKAKAKTEAQAQVQAQGATACLTGENAVPYREHASRGGGLRGGTGTGERGVTAGACACARRPSGCCCGEARDGSGDSLEAGYGSRVTGCWAAFLGWGGAAACTERDPEREWAAAGAAGATAGATTVAADRQMDGRTRNTPCAAVEGGGCCGSREETGVGGHEAARRREQRARASGKVR